MLGMAMITLVDRDRIRGSEGRAEDEQAVSRARLFFLSGVALMTGGLVGSIVRLLFPPPFYFRLDFDFL